MVEALKGKPGLMKQLKSIFDDLHVAKEFSVYPEFPRLFADPESSDLAHSCAIFLFFWVVKYSTGWGPPIGGCKSFWKVLRTGMTT